MGLRYNPLTGSFDLTRSPGSYLDGEVATYADLPLDTAAAPLNSAWLVRAGSGLWLLTRKPAGIYIRTATGGTDRDADYTYAGTFPDVFSDANFVVYNDADSTKNVKLDASALTTGTTRTLTVPNASGTLPLLETANTFTANQTLNGTNNVAPNQTAASGSSVMTRDLADARYPRWENTHDLNNLTGALTGVVSGGGTTFRPDSTQLRAPSGGGYRSINATYRGATTAIHGTLQEGAWRQRAVVSMLGDSRCFMGYFPVLGSPSAQWAGRGVGFWGDPTGGLPYFMYRADQWRAMIATRVRGSSSVFPVRASNVITVETNGAHGLVAGDYVSVAGVFPQSMQTWYSEVLSVPTSTSFTYANTGANETGTTISGDTMNIAKVVELGSIAQSVTSNAFSGTVTWEMEVAMTAAGAASFYANGTLVATGTGFSTIALSNAARTAFSVESLAASTTITDLYVVKIQHTIQ